MVNQLVSAECRVAPAQVWGRLIADRQARAIRLMAQLAFNLVLDQSNTLVEESDHVEPTHHAQDSA